MTFEISWSFSMTYFRYTVHNAIIIKTCLLIERVENLFEENPSDPSGFGRLYPKLTEEAQNKLSSYIEPTTGYKKNIDDREYLGIESIWNDKNLCDLVKRRKNKLLPTIPTVILVLISFFRQ